MQIWNPDTCYCEIRSLSPAIEGVYVKRCSIHANSRDTRDCYQYNIDHQERTTTDEVIREQKKRATREATRP